MRAVVVGATATARDLLRGMSERWEITVIDSDPAGLALAGTIRAIDETAAEDVVAAARDHLPGADALVAATNDDAINLEVCRAGIGAGLERDQVAAVAADPERIADYRELGVNSVSPDQLAARRVDSALDPRRVSSAAFADGMAEALEFRIAADSPLRGQSLQELHSESWLIVAILRDGELIIPHGGSELQADDHVTVTGAAADYASMVATFTAGEASFPLDFGSDVAVLSASVAELDGPVAEAAYFTEHSSAKSLLVMDASQDGSAFFDVAEGVAALEGTTPARFAKAASAAPGRWPAAAAADNAGVLAMEAPCGGRLAVQRQLIAALRAARAAGLPLLLTRGSHPYRTVVVATSSTPAGRAAGRAAVDLAAGASAELVGLAVVAPPFMAKPGVREELMAANARLRDQAAVRGVSAQRRIEEGNPVRVIEKGVGPGSLLVVGMPGRDPTMLRPGTALHLARRASSSVLVVPAPGGLRGGT